MHGATWAWAAGAALLAAGALAAEGGMGDPVIGDQAGGKPLDAAAAETSAGWVKSGHNPVLGGNLGTCFDVAVLREGETLRMWFSWRPRKSVALVESADGIRWGEPVIVLGPNPDTDWEEESTAPRW